MKIHSTPADAAQNLAADAQELLAATAHVAEANVMKARARLAAAMERGKEAWADVQERAIAGARATDHTIRENPYRSLGIALGVGAVIGYLLSRRSGRE